MDLRHTGGPIHSAVLAYLNGEYLPIELARISPFDRGFLFADGVYEVVRTGANAPDGSVKFVSLNRHVRRLTRSLKETGIDWEACAFETIATELVRRSGLSDALIYLQITRGTPDFASMPPRSHLPPKGLHPTVFAFARPIAPLNLRDPKPLVKRCVTLHDPRWNRCDIKSVSLLGNVLVAIEAQHRGGDDAVLLRQACDGGGWVVSESSLANTLIVTEAGELATPPLEGGSVLPGITRELLLDLDASIIERPVHESELRAAREVLLLGTTSAVTAVTYLDGLAVGRGEPGPHAVRLASLLGCAIREGRDDIG